MTLEFPTEVAQECAVHTASTDARHATNSISDARDVRLVSGEDRDVAHLVPTLDADEIDRAQQRARIADHRRDPSEGPGLVGQPHPEDRAEGR